MSLLAFLTSAPDRGELSSSLPGRFIPREIASCIHWIKNRDSSVGIATRLRAGQSGSQGSIAGGGWEFFSSPPRPERFWGSPSLLSSGYQGLFPWRKSGRSVKLTAHLHLVPRSNNEWSLPPLPNTPSWHGTQLNKSTGAALTLHLYHTHWIGARIKTYKAFTVALMSSLSPPPQKEIK
jgi:hypothetical protein